MRTSVARAGGSPLASSAARGVAAAYCFAVAAAAAAAAVVDVAAAAAADSRYRPDFRVYWNVPTFGCHRYGMAFNVSSAWGVVQNAEDAFRGERLTILYDPGLFPALVQEGGKTVARNGGAPQEGDLNRHLAALARDVDRLVPDVNFSGIGVVDMESWRPVWRQLFGSFKPYKEFSRQIERRRHPTYSEAQIEAEARSRFEAAAKTFMETSLELVSQMRPRAIWGYYAFPYCFNAPLQGCPAQVEQENNKLQWLFDASGALFPSVYLGSQTPRPGDRQAFVRARVAEAKRLAARAPRLVGPRVFAYVRYNYYDTADFLSPDALYTSIATPKNMDVNGVVIWGSWNDVKTKAKCEALQSYVGSVLGPIVKNLTDVSNNP
ncbi:hypothetical protein R5R35_005601 [Gryllus longicercus]|uniref:Hyaluronidase n=1 Tax=Gryllus longicercus TaxID=2509291 RepID=A0AAN9VHR1_9ORTH